MALKSNLNILICEPNKSARAITKTSFTQIGFKNINYTEDLKSTMEMIASNLKDKHIELLLINGDDNINNIALLKNFIDKIQVKRSPKLIATITNSDQQRIVQLVSLKINQILIKPFNQNQLVEKIAVLFNQ